MDSVVPSDMHRGCAPLCMQRPVKTRRLTVNSSGHEATWGSPRKIFPRPAPDGKRAREKH